MKLWDTNVLSELARPAPAPAVVAWAEAEHELAVSVVTVDEIFFGLAWRPQRRVEAWFERFLADRCTILEVSAEIARVSGRLRGRLRAAGRPRTQADMWIAATARVHDLPLATRNVRDFADCGVEIVDPFAER